jgi:hypothetical protein
MQNPRDKFFSNEEYERWERILKMTAKKQDTVSKNMLIDDRLSVSTHMRVMDLLTAVKKRVGEQEE